MTQPVFSRIDGDNEQHRVHNAPLQPGKKRETVTYNRQYWGEINKFCMAVAIKTSLTGNQRELHLHDIFVQSDPFLVYIE